MTGHAGTYSRIFAITLCATLAGACRSHQATAPAAGSRGSQTPSRGGTIIGSTRTEPSSFNRFTARDTGTELVSELTQAKLVRINEVTKEVEPALAESWTITNDARRCTLKLRSGVNFSDGRPFSADDVLFSFQAAYDERAGTVLADGMKVDGKPLQVAAPDPRTVTITFPDPFGAGIRLLDGLPILPKHKLQAALEAGAFGSAWGVSTPPSDIVGLGPFVIHEYLPGQRIVFDRNPQYWRRADDGAALPYLDRITIEIVPDQNAELLRLGTGQLDFTSSEVSPESYAPIKRAADEGRVTLHDLGVAFQADWFWINLKPGAFGNDPRASWLQRDELRRAIWMAVDRKVYADTVFFGAGEPVYGPETPANKKWYWSGVPRTAYDPEGAKTQLAAIGLRANAARGSHDADGLTDAAGRPARFTLLTQKGRPRLERGAAVIRDELKRIGLTVDVVELDGRAVIQRLVSGQYEATLFAPQPTDIDPALNPDLWLSSGSFHIWNPNQKKPATEWERQIDDLMARQIASVDEAERQRLFVEVQRVFVEHLPIVHFVAPRWYVAVSSRLVNARPAIYLLPVLWSADTLAVAR